MPIIEAAVDDVDVITTMMVVVDAEVVLNNNNEDDENEEEKKSFALLVDQARSFKATRRWRQRFYERYKLVTRKRTNKKSKALSVRIKLWQAITSH